MRAVGIHLQQSPALVGTPRPSVVAEVAGDGVVVRLAEAQGDDEILAAAGDGDAVVVVDAPLAVPNSRGRRDVEVLLSWLDHSPFPVSRERLVQLYGAVRGEPVARALRDRGWDVVEGVPDMVLRHLMWRGAHPAGDPVGLEAFRAAWLGLRPPRYRPKGTGRGTAAGLRPAWVLLAGAVDMAGWAPGGRDDDWGVISDAARLDAVACALTAHLLVTAPDGVVRVGSPERGEAAFPAGPDLRERAAVNLARLRAEGAIRI